MATLQEAAHVLLIQQLDVRLTLTAGKHKTSAGMQQLARYAIGNWGCRKCLQLISCSLDFVHMVVRPCVPFYRIFHVGAYDTTQKLVDKHLSPTLTSWLFSLRYTPCYSHIDLCDSRPYDSTSFLVIDAAALDYSSKRCADSLCKSQNSISTQARSRPRYGMSCTTDLSAFAAVAVCTLAFWMEADALSLQQFSF